MASTLTDRAGSGASDTRVDKWLWVVRIFRTRSLATVACRGGRILVNGSEAKPARPLRVADVVEVREGLYTRTFRMEGSPGSRVGAKLVHLYCTNLTPPEVEAARRDSSIAQRLALGRDNSRPGKRERRDFQKYFP